MSRVCRLLPPRRHVGARSSSSTDCAWCRAEIAATRPAFPPPTTTTSKCLSMGRAGSGARHRRHNILGNHLHVLDPCPKLLRQAVDGKPDRLQPDLLLGLE